MRNPIKDSEVCASRWGNPTREGYDWSGVPRTSPELVVSHLAGLREEVGEQTWIMLPKGHEEHPEGGFALMGAECERIDVLGKGAYRRAMALLTLLNWI